METKGECNAWSDCIAGQFGLLCGNVSASQGADSCFPLLKSGRKALLSYRHCKRVTNSSKQHRRRINPLMGSNFVLSGQIRSNLSRSLRSPPFKIPFSVPRLKWRRRLRNTGSLVVLNVLYTGDLFLNSRRWELDWGSCYDAPSCLILRASCCTNDITHKNNSRINDKTAEVSKQLVFPKTSNN